METKVRINAKWTKGDNVMYTINKITDEHHVNSIRL